MKRDMSYELDGVFSGRNAGELVQVRPARTRIGRTPGLKQQTVRSISAPLSSPMHSQRPHNITAHNTKSLAHGLGKSLNAPFYRNAGDLAGEEDDLACDDPMGEYADDADMPFSGMGDITLPFVGPVSKTGLVIAGIAGLIAWKMFKRA
jgi:hypothetical protein